MTQIDTPYYWCFNRVKTSIFNFSILTLALTAMFLLPDKVKAQCNASFSYYTDSYNGYKVHFTDYSEADYTDSIVSWHWDYGDGSTQNTAGNSEYTYSATGTYDVWLVIETTGGCHDSIQKSVTISSSSSCNLTANFSSYADSLGHTISFTNYSSGDVATYHWYFGDNDESYDMNPSHTYINDGTYYAYLYVYDSSGTCSDYTYVEIHVGNTPSCNLSAYFTASADSNGVLSVHNYSSGAEHYYWYFYDDYTSSNDSIPSHTYTTPGYHLVYLSISDANYNCSESYSDYVYFQGNSSSSFCLTDFSYNVDSANKSVSFTNLSLGNSSNTNYSWYFGDGGYSNDQNPTHQYANSGWYWVSFYTYDYNSYCSSSDGEYIYIPGAGCSVNAYFSYTVDQSNNTFTVHNQSSGNGLSYSWTYYNGYNYEYNNDENPTFGYSSNVLSTPYLELYVWDNNSCSSYYYEYLNLPITSCHANFSYSLDQTDTNKVYFYDYSWGSGSMTNWFWDFGDGSYSTDQNPSHTFAGGGYHTVTLTAKDSANDCSSTYDGSVYIPGACNVKAGFSYKIDQATGQVVVSDNSIGAYYYYWYFYDGINYQYSNDANPTFTYDSTANVYSSPYLYVSVYDQSWSCYSSDYKDVNIPGLNFCQASFGTYVDGPTLTAYFYDYSYGQNGAMTHWNWYFGDGSYSTDQNPVHQYAQGGYYKVKLTAKDSVSDCASVYETDVYVPGACNVKVDFTYSASNGQVTVSDNSIGGYYYYWYFYDGTNYQYSYDANPTFTYDTLSSAYSSPALYLSIYSQDWTCYSYDYKNANLPGKSYCQANFGTYVDGPTLTAYFTDYSWGQNGGMTHWNWHFGDGSYSTDQNPVHQYAQGGYYKVKLTAKDSVSDCVSVYETDVYVPGACNVKVDFTYSASNGQVTVSDNSIGGYYYYWYFYDGTNYQYSYDANPTFTYDTLSSAYSSPALYLSIYSQDWSCYSYDYKNANLPGKSYCQANFGTYVDGNTSMAYFTDYSWGQNGGMTHWNWYFGDGSYSTDQNPTHQYAQGGYYKVKLTAKDSVSDCASVYETDVYVPGACNINASFTYSVDQNNNQIQFKSGSIGTGLYYYWYFWNGNYYEYSYDENPVFNYSANGISSPYVYLYVYDANWCSAYDWDYPAIPNMNTCHASYGYYVDGNTMTGYFYDYSSSSNGVMTNWSWDFGDGYYSHDQNPIHPFAQGGYYNVKLAVKDSVSDCVSQYESYVYVPGSCNVNASFTYSVDQTNNQILVTNQSIGSGLNYYWYYWDGVNYEISYDANPVFSYNGSVNTYPYIYLSVYDNNCSASYDLYAVLPNVTYCSTDFTYLVDPNTSEVQFTNLSWASNASINKSYWYFDDGIDSHDKNPKHTFASGGYHWVYLTTSDSVSGCYSDKYDYVYIPVASACNASYSYIVDSSMTVYFADKSIGNISSWYWYFDDGAWSYDQNPMHQFATDGFHYVYLSIYDSNTGCQAYTYDNVYIPGATVACNAAFGFYLDANNDVYFTNKSQGIFTDYYWDFGDVNYSNSNQQNPMFNYGGAGNYYVCLSVYDSVSACQASYCDFVTIVDTSSTSTFCAAEYIYYPNSATNEVYFTDKSVGNVNAWYWNYGDGTAAGSTQNPDHLYDHNGYYKACETVWTDNGCQETFCDVVAVGDVTYSCYAEYSYYADKVTSTAHFKNLSKGNITSYYWDFGDGYSSVQKTPSHTYADTGYYAVCLTVYSDSCVNSFCDIIRIGNAVANPCKFSCVWPGDANNDLEANQYDLLSIGLNYGYSGPKRDSVSIMWLGQSGTEWATWQTNGANNMHADCNGDGTVDLTDVAAIDSNFAYSHPYQMKKQKSGNDLTFEVLTTNIYPGATVEVAIVAGDSANVTMYGIGWQLGMNTKAVDMSTVTTTFANSWLGTQGNDLLGFSQTDVALGKVNMSTVRNDHTMKTNKGEIARVTFTIDADANGEDLSLELTTFGGVTNTGDTVPFTSGGNDSIVVTGIINNIGETKSIKVYPNPTSGDIAFSLPSAYGDVFDIKIYNSLSQVVYQERNSNGGVVKLDLGNVADGMYSIYINSNNSGRYYQTFDVIK